MSLAVVVAAAGRGDRLGLRQPKALVELAGRPLIAHALDAVAALDDVAQVVVVHPADAHDAFVAAVSTAHVAVTLVAGGATRSDSVRAGLAAARGAGDLVAIHDAARPLTPPAVFTRTTAAVIDDVIAAAPGREVSDTLKRVSEGARVAGTVLRDSLWAVHTPQVFRRDALDATLSWAGRRTATDELRLVESALAVGVVRGVVQLVPGDPRDLKITYRSDVVLAEAILAVPAQRWDEHQP